MAPSPEEREEMVKKAIDEAVRRVAGHREQAYVRPLLEELVRNNAIPMELLRYLPVQAAKAGKTRFDQLYDAAMYLVFPGYRQDTLEKLLGPKAEISESVRIWRVVLPDKFGIAHVLIRASSFQEAFARACDYACRMSLRIYKRIPADLTIRVMFMTERAIRRRLALRWANRVHKRKNLQLDARVYTPRELAGARLAALGHPRDPFRSLARYVEVKDLQRILDGKGMTKISEVEAELLRQDAPFKPFSAKNGPNPKK